MAKQPIPIVMRADVERVVSRDFHPAQHEAVLAMLEEYGLEAWHGEVDRVHLAILKLSAGDIGALRHHVETAKKDFRDVVTFAEYPTCTSCGFDTFRLPPEDRQTIFDQDWEQYESWLRQ